MYKGIMSLGLLIFLNIHFINCMEEGFSDNPYKAKDGWNSDVVSSRPASRVLVREVPFNMGNPRNFARSSQVMPEVLPKAYVAQVVENITDYYVTLESILNLNAEAIGYQLTWDDIRKDLYPAFIKYNQELINRGKPPIEILNFANNNLLIQDFPMEILIHMIQSPSLKKVSFEGNRGLCESEGIFRILAEGYSHYLNTTRSGWSRFANFFISGIIQQGEEKLEITQGSSELIAARDVIIFDLGGGREVVVQKKIINLPNNILSRLTPLFSKLSIVAFLSILTTLGTYFLNQTEIYTGECSAEYIYYLLSGCDLNATQFFEFVS